MHLRVLRVVRPCVSGSRHIKDLEEEETLTFPGVLGVEETEVYASRLLSAAIDSLRPYEKEAEELLFLADEVMGFCKV